MIGILDPSEIQGALSYPEIVRRMRDAVISYSCGECDTPMPMHLEVAAERAGLQFESSYCRRGRVPARGRA